MSSCKGCGAKIRWVVSQLGSPMPVDPDPTPEGNLVINNRGVARVVKGSRAERDKFREQGAVLYRAHFATCAHPRKKRNSGAYRRFAS